MVTKNLNASLVVLICVLVLGCATSKSSGDDKVSEQDRYSILKKSILNEKCDSTIVEQIFKSNSNKLPSKKPDEAFSDRISEIMGGEGVAKLNEMPDEPAANLVALSANKLCAAEFELISNHSMPQDFAMGLNQITLTSQSGYVPKTFMDKLEKATSLSDANSTLAPMEKVLNIIVKRLKDDCSSSITASCAALDRFKNIMSLAASLEVSRARSESADGILDQACHSYETYQRKLKFMEDEREKGKISGYINVSYLKTWGDEAHYYKKEFDSFNQQYKLKAKKNINPKLQCPQ